MTLIEALFVCMLVGTVLAVTAQIFRDYSRVLNSRDKRDEVREAVEQFSFMLRADGIRSFQITSPPPNGSSARFSGTIFQPRADRFNDPATWSRDAASDTKQVTYFLRGENLVRDSAGEEEEFLDQVESSSFALDEDNLLTASLVLKTVPKATTLQFKIYLPSRRAP